MSNEDMQGLTDPSKCITPPDSLVYLGFDQIEWEIFGKVNQYNISTKEVCPMTDGSVKFFLPSKNNFVFSRNSDLTTSVVSPLVS